MIYSSAFYRSTMLLIAGLVFFISCAGNGVQREDPDELTETQKQVIEYFKEVALGFEFGNASEVARKWDQQIVIFVGGEENDELQSELTDIISELNGLISMDGVELSFTSDSTASNFYVFFGEGEDYAEIMEDAEGFTDENFGLFFIDWNSSTFTHGTMYVDTERPASQNQLHLLREEFTQSFGLAKDSPRYSDSIFSSDYSVNVTEYSAIDKAIIQLLYHPEIEFGMDEAEVDSVLRRIVDEVIE